MDQLDHVPVADRPRTPTDHQLLPGRETPETGTPSSAPPGDLPAWVLHNPPVVDVFEGVTCDLLLVGTSSSVFIPEDSQQALTSPTRADALTGG